MKSKIRNRKSIAILGMESLGILLFFLLVRTDSDIAMLRLTGLAALVSLCVTLSVLHSVSRTFSYFHLFIAFAYLFSFGQSMLMLFGYRLPKSAFSISSSGFSAVTIRWSSLFVILALQCTSIGYCLISRKTSVTDHMAEISDRRSALTVGWGLLLLSIVPTFYLLVKDIVVTFTVSYGSTLGPRHGIDKICQLISGFFPSSLLILFNFEQRRKQRRIVYLLILAFCALEVIGGSRIEVFRLAVTLFIVAFVVRKSLTRKNLIALFLLLIAGLFVFSLVSSARIYLNDVSNPAVFIAETMGSLLKKNFLLSAVGEMGNTQIINTLVYAECPEKVGFQYGFSYVKMLWAILPNIWGKAYTGYIGVDITFSPLYSLTEAGLGASYVSEAYWNFGWFALLYCAFFGAAIGKTENILTDHANRKQSSAVPIFLALYVMFFIIFMVRGEMLEFGRSMVYYAIIPVLLMRWYDRMIREKKQGYSGGKMNKILGKISSRIPGRNRP